MLWLALLRHKLFGTDFVICQHGYKKRIFKVYNLPNGQKAITAYDDVRILNKDLTFDGMTLGYKPLTFTVKEQNQ